MASPISNGLTAVKSTFNTADPSVIIMPWLPLVPLLKLRTTLIFPSVLPVKRTLGHVLLPPSPFLTPSVIDAHAIGQHWGLSGTS